MRSRVMPAIGKLFDDPQFKGDKHDVCSLVHCDVKSAQKVLTDLWMNNNIYVLGWERRNGGAIPIYAKRSSSNQQDVPRPVPKKDIPFLERDIDRIYAQCAERARLKKSLANRPTMGFWGI